LKSKLNEQLVKVNNILDEIFELVCLKKSEILVQNTRSPQDKTINNHDIYWQL